MREGLDLGAWNEVNGTWNVPTTLRERLLRPVEVVRAGRLGSRNSFALRWCDGCSPGGGGCLLDVHLGDGRGDMVQCGVVRVGRESWLGDGTG